MMKSPFIALLFPFALFSNPQGHTPILGESVSLENGPILEVTTGDRAVIEWDSFSIQPNEVTRFIQPSIDSAVLNRVTGSDISELMGRLEANGAVYLVNPNGIFIGSEGSIQTASFIATTLDIPDTSFIELKSFELKGESFKEIINLGKIETSKGPIAIAAHRIENSGTLRAVGEKVSLTSGHHLLLDPTGDALLYIHPNLKADGVDHQGLIEALKVQIQADGSATACAIGIGGIIEANSIEQRGGEIYLTAKEGAIEIEKSASLQLDEGGFISLNAENDLLDFQGAIKAPSSTCHLLGKNVYLQAEASIDLSGDGKKELLIGGDYQGKNPSIPNAEYTFCGKDVSIQCSGIKRGDGGKVIFWGDEGVAFFGTVLAEGGAEMGDGGFVEVSSPKQHYFSGLVSRLAPFGKAGVLLLDPTDITISTAATSGGSFVGGTFSSTLASATLQNTDLEANLAAGDVIINASVGGGGSNGNITFNSDAPVTWSTNNLGLIAPSAVIFRGAITISGTGTLSFPSTPDKILVLSNSTFTITAATAPSFVSSTSIGVLGTINSSSSGDISFSAPTVTFSPGTVTSSGAGGINITATLEISSQGGSIISSGSGGLTLDFSGSAGGAFSDNVTLTSNSPLTITPFSGLGLFFSGNVNINAPSVTCGIQVFLADPTTINTSSSSFTFSGGITDISTSTFAMNAPSANIYFSDACDAQSWNVSAGGDINLSGNNFTAAAGALALTAGNSINISDGATVSAPAAVTLIAGNDIIGSGTGTIKTTGAFDLTLVSDNDNGSPNFGSGKFNLGGYTLLTDNGSGIEGNGKVLLFTAVPIATSGSLPSVINTANYTPGTFSGSTYNTGTNEFVGYWYGQAFPDPPLFEVIYKSTGVVPEELAVIEVAVTEPVANPTQITQVTEGNLQPPATPDPTTPCRTPPVAVQSI